MSGLRWAGALLAGIAFTGFCVWVVLSARRPPAVAQPPPSPAPAAAATASPGEVEPVVDAPSGPSDWLDGVVCLRGSGDGDQSRFSGFVADASGLVVTTAHGIDDDARFDVVFRNGQVENATSLVRDPELDLALFEVRIPDGVEALVLGEFSDVQEGAELWVMGCPAGGEATVSRGIVASRPSRARVEAGPPLFHADAKAFPGSSGGPLVDPEGRVIGVVKGILEDADGRLASLPLAIPASFARALVSRGWDERNGERAMSGLTANGWLERGLDATDPATKIDAYRTCIDANAYSAACRFNLALLTEQSGEREAARIAYRDLLRMRPDFELAYQNLIALEVDAGSLDSAESVCDAALTMLAAPAEIANNCGLVARQRGEADKARRRFDQALRTDPDYAIAHLNRAVLIDRDLGRCREALDDYRAFAARVDAGAERDAAMRAIDACEEATS